MQASGVRQPPYVSLFVLFAAYGGWLMIFLTLRFWYWSGMALLGLMGLVFVAPAVIFAMSIYLFPKRKVSGYHYGAFVASVGYVCFVAALLIYRAFFWE